MADVIELRTRYVFLLGPAYDDLVPAFVIDGRDYSDPEAVRADVGEASELLDKNHVVAEYETQLMDENAPRSELPTWPEFREQHVMDERFDDSVPTRAGFRRPAGWDELWVKLEEDRAFLREQLFTLARAALPGGDPFVKYDRGPARRGDAVPDLAGEVYGATVAIAVGLGDGESERAVTDGAAALTEMGWAVGPVRREERHILADADRDGFQVTVMAEEGRKSLTFLGKTPLLCATQRGTVRVPTSRE